MGWIKDRIIKEYMKHGDRLDWAGIAELKILAQLKEMNEETKKISKDKARDIIYDKNKTFKEKERVLSEMFDDNASGLSGLIK